MTRENEVSNEKVVALREERALLASRLQRLKHNLSETNSEFSSMSDKPLLEQRRVAKKEIMAIKSKRDKVKQKLMVDKLKFVFARYNRLTNDVHTKKLLDEFLREPLKNAKRMSLAETLSDVREKVETGVISTRKSETTEVIGILKKLTPSKLAHVAQQEEGFASDLKRNKIIIGSSNPLERVSLKRQALKQEITNVEAELEIISERIRRELKSTQN